MKTKQQLMDEMKSLEDKLQKKKDEIAKIEEKERKELEGEILRLTFSWQEVNQIPNDKLISTLKKQFGMAPVRKKRVIEVSKEEPKDTDTVVKNEVPKEKEPNTGRPGRISTRLKKFIPGLEKEDVDGIVSAIKASDNTIVVDMQLRFFLKDRAAKYTDAVVANFADLKAAIES